MSIVQKNVQDRYAAGSKKQEAALCCPINYDPEYLKIIPQEVLERDYGCGDPSKYVEEGETVLDLGSGGGKICFIASQIVGKNGKVIGIDMTPDMLELARRSAPIVAEKLGYSNVEFKRGYIQNLQLDLDILESFLEKNPVQNSSQYDALQEKISDLEKNFTMIPDNSIDVIVSNCVLNLVSDAQKNKLFEEMFRVLKKGGRIAISDIVSDEDSPKNLKEDEKLWSGCISGALQESEFCTKLEDTGFYGITIDKFEQKPWQVVEGIEYRSVTILAWKGKQGDCWDKNQAVIYKGPWKNVEDDDDHMYMRGERTAVCEKTFEILQKAPYKDFIIPIEPSVEVTDKKEFSCLFSRIKSPQETKAGREKKTSEPSQGSCC